MDIEALYTNIPQYEALQAVRQLFVKEGMTDHLLFVLDCLKIVLEGNFFEFDGKVYQQKKGVSMGAACAPSVANIYVGLFEQTHIYNEMAPFYENFRLWSRHSKSRLIPDDHYNTADSTCSRFLIGIDLTN
ncbi:hypothetical protein NDU88_002391 [Pleurodeles waltl]|uniref:Reverse transcriptase domain-containing protein n=1 Tax=Pleurodeles waltl TaxID=8319 RepID=A0AAV7KTE6_PLEWA|nr:hypothetical protein NDU88_002391 [Pleurodeles waltl]